MKLLALIFLPLFGAAQSFPGELEKNNYSLVSNHLANGKPKQALMIFDKIMAETNTNGEELLTEQYFGMALNLALQGYYRESIRYHKKALRSHRKFHKTESTEIEINLGLTYQLAGREKKARRILGELYPS